MITGPTTTDLRAALADQPALMAAMVTALDVHDGHRVLEVGTGTGYNAALLAHRLGDSNVTTIEVDPAVSRRARQALVSAVPRRHR